MKDKIIPPLVLTIVSVVVSGLIVMAYNTTYVDNTGVMTDKLKAGCESIFGEANYEIITFEDENGEKTPLTFDNITNVIVDENREKVIFEVVCNGYAKDGIDVLVGINTEDKVEGVSIITLGETPGLGTKVKNQAFLDSFKMADVKTDISQIDSITGATYSSNGMKNAVKIALDTYTQNKEAIKGE